MAIQIRKFFLLALCILMFLLALWYLYSQYKYTATPSEVPMDWEAFKMEKKVGAAPDSHAVTGENLDDVKNSDMGKLIATTFMGTPAEAAEVKKWLAARGHMYGEEDLEYQAYDQSTLETLAAQGDIRAMQRLADIYKDKDHLMVDGYGFAGADKLYWNAAVYGSTEALVSLARSYESQVHGWAETDEEEKKAAMEVLAIYNVTALRGNRYPNLVLANSFKHRMGAFELTAEDLASIEDRSLQIYEQLQAKRIELGLDDFDNSVPDAVVRFFDRYEGIQKSNSQIRK